MPYTGMPYFFETGPTFEVLEDFANSSTNRLVDALIRLKAGESLPDIGALDSKTLDRPGDTKTTRIAHVNQDWFGKTQDKAGKWVAQAKFDPKAAVTTGYWRAWYGDAEGIVRMTLIRAAEVALGLRPDQPIERATVPPRHWPITFIWKCSQSWFEGWVAWQSRPGSGGHVTVIFATPANGHPVLTSPLAPPQRSLPEYVEPPSSTVGERGQWVITHASHVAHHDITSRPTESGRWVYPNFGRVYEGTGDIVTVAPSEADGGVLSSGRSYVP